MKPAFHICATAAATAAMAVTPAAHANTNDDLARQLRLSPVRGVEREYSISTALGSGTMRVFAARDGSQLLIRMDGRDDDRLRILYRRRGDVLAVQGLPPRRKRWYVLGARRYARSIERIAAAQVRAAERRGSAAPAELTGDQVYSFDAKPLFEGLVIGAAAARAGGERAASVRGSVQPLADGAMEVVNEFLSATDQQLLRATTVVGPESEVRNLAREAEYEVGWEPEVRLARAPRSRARAAQSEGGNAFADLLYKVVETGIKAAAFDVFVRGISPKWGPTIAGRALGAGVLGAVNGWFFDSWVTFYRHHMDILLRPDEPTPPSGDDRAPDPGDGTGLAIPRLAPVPELAPATLAKGPTFEVPELSPPQLTPIWLVPPCPPDLGPLLRLSCELYRSLGLPWPP